MVLERLSESLKGTLRKIARSGTVDRNFVDEFTAEIKRALISSDVNIELANEIVNSIRKRSLDEKPAGALTAKEHTVNIVYEELVKYLGSAQSEIKIAAKPTKILLVGLFGSGKTTTAAKLAKYYKKKGYKVALVQTDTWRPAAYEQLKQNAEKVNVPFFGLEGEKDPVAIYNRFEKFLDKFNIVIVDSAGRDALNEELVGEIKKISDVVKPHESLLVLSGDIGQGAQKQAEMFEKAVGVGGVIVTKLDGTAKGGGALTACAATNAKVKFLGVGEKPDALEEFKPKNFVSRLLGMGDLETLLKKAEEAISKEQAEKIGKKVSEGKFSLTDLSEQIEAMKKMGPLSQIMSMIPGLSGMSVPKELLGGQEEKIKVWKHCMDSMTPDEKENPDTINPSRVKRIAKGSGREESDVRELLKQHKQMKKVLKLVGNQRQLKKMSKMFGKGGMPNIPGMNLPKGFKVN
jgi:signal recognition particle subunit SRP54